MARNGEQPPRRSFGPGRPRRGDRAPLTSDQIVEEALRLIDDVGPSGLSMRKLALRLGVEAMSLYAHIADKDELLNAVADRVAAELTLPAVPREDWRLRIRTAVEAWAGMEAAHPGAFPLLYRDRAGTENERAITEEIMAALATAGFGPTDVALAYQTLVSFLDGALLHWPRSTWAAASAWGYVAARVDAIRYPVLAGTAPHAARLEWDEVFYTGLDLLLSGLEDRLARVGVRGTTP